jgi:hypothetical protein
LDSRAWRSENEPNSSYNSVATLAKNQKIDKVAPKKQPDSSGQASNFLKSDLSAGKLWIGWKRNNLSAV